MTKKKTPEKLTVREQIDCVKNLSQGAAAELLGIASATLRAHTSAPRNDDESYDAAKLVAWRLSNVLKPDLDDDQTEKFLRATENFLAGYEWAFPAISRFFHSLVADHGDGGRVMIADAVLEYLADFVGSLELHNSEESVRQQEQRRREQERRDEAERELNVASVCDCGKVRHGKRWIMPRIKPPFTIGSVCPDCMRK